jgi:hypothetical protein
MVPTPTPGECSTSIAADGWCRATTEPTLSVSELKVTAVNPDFKHSCRDDLSDAPVAFAGYTLHRRPSDSRPAAEVREAKVQIRFLEPQVEVLL